MSLVLRRKPGGEGISIDDGRIVIRVARVDSDKTVHLSIIAPKDVHILREELIGTEPKDHAAGEHIGEVRRIPDCSYCKNTGRDPQSDNVNWLSCPMCERTGL